MLENFVIYSSFTFNFLIIFPLNTKIPPTLFYLKISSCYMLNRLFYLILKLQVCVHAIYSLPRAYHILLILIRNLFFYDFAIALIC